MNPLIIARRLLWGIVAVVCITVVSIVAWRWQARAISEANPQLPLEGLKNFGAVPDFTFTERSGRKVSLADLKGKVWVAQFFYTHCTDICPLTVPQMGLLHLEYLNDPDFRSAVHFVSITIDPERDTPEVAKKTGEDKELFHSSRLILIDRNAQIRGYYSGIDAEAMVRLRRDLKTLLVEKLSS